MLNKDIENLKDIMESIAKISEFTGKFSNADLLHENALYFDATLMNFVNNITDFADIILMPNLSPNLTSVAAHI